MPADLGPCAACGAPPDDRCVQCGAPVCSEHRCGTVVSPHCIPCFRLMMQRQSRKMLWTYGIGAVIGAVVGVYHYVIGGPGWWGGIYAVLYGAGAVQAWRYKTGRAFHKQLPKATLKKR